MDWDAWRAFLAVARTGRTSAAARRLDVEHTTVSRRIAALEADLGVSLFYRTARGYALTPHGQNAIGEAEAMERAALALAARAREQSDTVAGRVRIAMAPEFASHWLAPNLKSFGAANPQLDLQILVGTRERDLSRGEAELAIQSPRTQIQHLVAVRLARTSMALFAARSVVPYAKWRVTAPDALGALPLMAYTSGFQLLQSARWFQPLLTTGRVRLETNSTHALVAAALAGAGVAVLPRFVARAHADLVAVSEDVAVNDVWLITHPDVRRDPRIRRTAEFLRGAAKALGDV